MTLSAPLAFLLSCFFFSSRRRHTRLVSDWSSDVCSSDLAHELAVGGRVVVVRSREGNRLANSAPLDNYPTADGKFVCIVAGSDANFARLCKARSEERRVGKECSAGGVTLSYKKRHAVERQ